MNRRPKFTKVVGFIVFTLVACELLLRLAGVAMLIPSGRLNVVKPEDATRLRILTLGESTTADIFSSDNSGAWPRMLERKLKQSGIDARVYNEGLPGTTTPLIYLSTASYLDRYKPQIVISMMGIHDDEVGKLNLDSSLATRARLQLNRVRLVRIAAWIRNQIASTFGCQMVSGGLDWRRLTDVTDRAAALAVTNSVAQIVSMVKSEVTSDREVAVVLAMIERRFRGELQSEPTAMAMALSDMAFALFPYDTVVAFRRLNDSIYQTATCSSAAHKILQCGNSVPDNLLTAAIQCQGFEPTAAEISLFRSRGLIYSAGNSLSTGEVYRLFSGLLQERNVQLIAMQYPTLPVEQLKQLFFTDGRVDERFTKIVFVSNENNFRDALALTLMMKYSAIELTKVGVIPPRSDTNYSQMRRLRESSRP